MPTNMLFQPVFLIEKYLNDNNRMHILLRNKNYISHTYDDGKKWVTINFEKNSKMTPEYAEEWFSKERAKIKGCKKFVYQETLPEEESWITRCERETNFISTKQIRKFNLT